MTVYSTIYHRKLSVMSGTTSLVIGQRSDFKSLTNVTFGTKYMYCVFRCVKVKKPLEWGEPYSKFSFGEVFVIYMVGNYV